MPIPSDWGNNMFDSRLIEAIKKAEGFKLKAYKDSVGLWTIGYGHLLRDQEQDYSGYSITEEEATALLMADLKVARTNVLALSLTGVNGVRIGAIIELMFNMGPHRLAGFHKMWAAWHLNDYATAAKELLDSKWAEQVGPARSERIASMIETGAYPE